MRSQLKKRRPGAAMEEALILDNKYTEHSTVGLAQQWDQLDQLGMRMQHNLSSRSRPGARGRGVGGGTCRQPPGPEDLSLTLSLLPGTRQE